MVLALLALGVMILRPGREAVEVAGENDRREPAVGKPATTGGESKPPSPTETARTADTPAEVVDRPSPARPLAADVSPPESKKDVFFVGKGTLEMVTTVLDDRRVRFVFVARNFGQDYSPLTDWINNHQDVFQRKLKELGLGTGTWERRNLTWPPRLSNDEATFEVTFQRQ